MKNDLKTLLLSSVLATCSLCVAQNPGKSPSAKPQAPAKEQATAPVAAEPWIQQLGSDRYRDRVKAENKLRELGEAAVPALERASKQTTDAEIQWRAKRLLRQIREGRGLSGLVERTRDPDDGPRRIEPGRVGRRGPRGVDEMQREFDRLFQRFERDFGLDIPRHRFFDDTFFRDLRSQLKPSRSGGGMSVQVGPGGVRVELEEVGEDGKAETKVYEAPDMESFQEQYPDVLKRSGLRMGLQPLELGLGARDGLRGRFGPIMPGFDRDLLERHVLPFSGRRQTMAPAANAPPAGQRLGVSVCEIPDDVRRYLGLGEVGLMIAEVQDDSLASALGLTVDDIVVRIGKHDIRSPADVRRVLGGIQKGAPVQLEYIRKGRRQTAEASKLVDGVVPRDVLKPRRAERSAGKQSESGPPGRKVR